MRIQTWAVRVQIHSDGTRSWDLVHSFYTPQGRQLPRQLAAGDCGTPREFHEVMATLEDMILNGEVWADWSVQMPLP